MCEEGMLKAAAVALSEGVWCFSYQPLLVLLEGGLIVMWEGGLSNPGVRLYGGVTRNLGVTYLLERDQ